MKMLRSLISITLLCSLLNSELLFAQNKLPENLPSNPRLLFKKTDIKNIKERISRNKWAQNKYESLKLSADLWLKKKITLPDKGGQWYHYYSCPEHGARLVTESASRHICPIDRKVFSGYPYDDVVIMSEHNGFANAVKSLGIIYQLTDDKKYALKAKEILLEYAKKYQSYPLHNIRGQPQIGGGKVGPQTLDESTWLITIVEGADCIWETLSADEIKMVTEGLLIPATDIIRKHKIGIHNIQCWKNSAVGLTGLLIGNLELVNEALYGESGYFAQIKKGTMADGAWYEGAWGYHFYTISALLHLTEACYNCGINLYTDELKKMFDAPILMAMPNLDLPPFNDSYVVNLPASGAVYEIAFARFNDNRYRLVIESGSRSHLEGMLYGKEFSGEKPSYYIVSTNFPSSGYAILTSGTGIDSTWFCMDYGPHGGGHGHPDKLSFVLYSKGEVLAPDPGTANYGVPIQANWYRSSIAHNTLTVDETSQQPADGSCIAFIKDKDFSAVIAHAGKIDPEVSFYRCAALFKDRLLVVIDSIKGIRPRIFDIAYHQRGVFIEQAGTPIDKLSDRPGYNQLRGLKSFSSDDFARISFQTPGKNKLSLILAGGEKTQIITGTGVGRHTEDRVPVVIARRYAEKTAFVWAIILNEEKVDNYISTYPLETIGEDAVAPAAARFKMDGQTFVLVSNPLGATFKLGNQQYNHKVSLFITDNEKTFHFSKGAR